MLLNSSFPSLLHLQNISSTLTGFTFKTNMIIKRRGKAALPGKAMVTYPYWMKLRTFLARQDPHSGLTEEKLESNYTKFCIGLKIRKSRCRTTLTLRFGSLKMIFECSIARCDVGLGRAIVQCQKNPLRKPKLSINRAILSAHFSAVKFCIGFFCWICFFLVLHRLFL